MRSPTPCNAEPKPALPLPSPSVLVLSSWAITSRTSESLLIWLQGLRQRDADGQRHGLRGTLATRAGTGTRHMRAARVVSLSALRGSGKRQVTSTGIFADASGKTYFSCTECQQPILQPDSRPAADKSQDAHQGIDRINRRWVWISISHSPLPLWSALPDGSLLPEAVISPRASGWNCFGSETVCAARPANGFALCG